MFQTDDVVKIKIHVLCPIIFVKKLCHSWDNEGKYPTARQATEDNIIRRMRIACWITHTQSM